MRVSLSDVETLRRATAQLDAYKRTLELSCATEKALMEKIEKDLSSRISNCSAALEEVESHVQEAWDRYNDAESEYNSAVSEASSLLQ